MTTGTALAPRALKKDPQRNYASQPPSWSTSPPASASRMYLEMYKEDGVILDRLRTGKRAVHSFGRNADVCTHALEHGSISRQHALIVHTPSGPFFVDLHSSQGSKVNGRRVEPGEPVRLCDDDVLELGTSSRKYKVKASGRARGANGVEEDAQPQPQAASNGGERPREKRSREEDAAHPPSQRPKSDSSASTRVRASHILVKHAQSRRPSSHRQDVITRTPEEARRELEDIRASLAPHLTLPLAELLPRFASLATERSDCSSGRKGGDLGKFAFEQMQRAFSEVAFKLQVGEVSDIVSTESGLHIILRTE